MNSAIVEKAKKVIKDNLYLTISVADESNSPWTANLYYAYDKDYNFYWYSPEQSRHSKIIRANPKVAISIFDSRAVGEDVDAVYMEAEAYELEGKKELLSGLLAYGKKMLRTKFVNSQMAYKKFIRQYKDFKGNSPLRMYKAVPKKVWKLADTEMYKDKFVDSRVAVELV
jgi:uncharacterized protein YhbP (UPF0306 family)